MHEESAKDCGRWFPGRRRAQRRMVGSKTNARPQLSGLVFFNSRLTVKEPSNINKSKEYSQKTSSLTEAKETTRSRETLVPLSKRKYLAQYHHGTYQEYFSLTKAADWTQSLKLHSKKIKNRGGKNQEGPGSDEVVLRRKTFGLRLECNKVRREKKKISTSGLCPPPLPPPPRSASASTTPC